jgi:hypothetical protein
LLDPKKTWVWVQTQNPNPHPQPKFFLGVTNPEFNSIHFGEEIKKTKKKFYQSQKYFLCLKIKKKIGLTLIGINVICEVPLYFVCIKNVTLLVFNKKENLIDNFIENEITMLILCKYHRKTDRQTSTSKV